MSDVRSHVLLFTRTMNPSSKGNKKKMSNKIEKIIGDGHNTRQQQQQQPELVWGGGGGGGGRPEL